MAYIYLFTLYEKIEESLVEIEQKIQASNKDLDAVRFQEGRADILREFKKYLEKNLNQKLPKRMRQKLLEKNNVRNNCNCL